MEPDIATRYEIPRTAEFIRAGAYTRVALQVTQPPEPSLFLDSSKSRLEGVL
jgi:hypothetical protein